MNDERDLRASDLDRLRGMRFQESDLVDDRATRGGRRPRAARAQWVAVPPVLLAGLVTVSALGAVAAVLLLLVLLEPPSTYCPDCAAVRERNAAIRWYFESGQARREFPGLGDYVPDLEGFPMPEGEEE